jgi:hypothetical protein
MWPGAGRSSSRGEGLTVVAVGSALLYCTLYAVYLQDSRYVQYLTVHTVMSVQSPSHHPPDLSSSSPSHPTGRVLPRSSRSDSALPYSNIALPPRPQHASTYLSEAAGRGHLSHGDSRAALAVSLVRPVPPSPSQSPAPGCFLPVRLSAGAGGRGGELSGGSCEDGRNGSSKDVVLPFLTVHK